MSAADFYINRQGFRRCSNRFSNRNFHKNKIDIYYCKQSYKTHQECRQCTPGGKPISYIAFLTLHIQGSPVAQLVKTHNQETSSVAVLSSNLGRDVNLYFLF